MADLLLDPLPTVWEGRAIDWDFRPMVWLSNQYQRGFGRTRPTALASEALRRFYRDPVSPVQAPDAFAGLLRFYRGPAPPVDSGQGGGSASGEIALDFACDAGYLVGAFQQAYGIDLTAERIHWWRFLALLKSLPEDTTLAKIIGWRTMDTSDLQGKQRQRYEDLKEAVALPRALRGTRTAVTVKEHDSAFLARFRHRDDEEVNLSG